MRTEMDFEPDEFIDFQQYINQIKRKSDIQEPKR